MLVHEYLTFHANRHAEKIALICNNNSIRYGELDLQSNQMANWLISKQFQRGDRAIVFLPNCIEAVISIYGILKAGGVFVVVNPSTKSDKLLQIISNCRANVIITNSDLFPVFTSIQPQVVSINSILICDRNNKTNLSPQVSLFTDILKESDHLPRVPIIDLDLACLVYTSGSTGIPKGVMSDHSNITFVANSIISILNNTDNDILINALPLSFDYGLYQLIMCIMFGGKLILEENFYFPAVILKRISEQRVTGFPGVPTIYSMILTMDLSPYDLSSLRYMTNTAAALPVSHIQEIRKKFPHVTFYSMYGLTETKRTLYLPPDQLDIRPSSVGIAIPGTEVWLEDENGNRVPPGGSGELVIRGRHVMRGYWGDPELTAKRYREGPIPGERICYSGDIFRMDEEGYLYFVRRSDDVIKSRGEKVSPVEIELVLYELPDVKEAAVIGVTDPVMGEAIKAYVVLHNKTLTEAQILAHCRRRLEEFKIPRMIQICDSLPKTSSGKIHKKGLS